MDDSMVHESHGSQGTYTLDSGMLHVEWKDFPAEDFVEIDGIYTHRALVRDLPLPYAERRPKGVIPREPAGIQVVSLRRTPERRDQFVKLNPGIHFEFFDAVDGQNVARAAFFNGTLADPNLPYSAGAIGCALSHLSLWERSIKEQMVMTIVEDDVALRRDFETKSRDIIASLPGDWDLIMWGWNFDAILSINTMPGISSTVIVFDQTMLRQSISRFQRDLFEPHIFLLDKCFGTCAYSISPAGSLKFRRLCFPLRNEGVFFPFLNRIRPNDGIDIAMNRIYALTNSYVSFPPLAVTPNINEESLTLARR
ncbi:MAG TPA: glycosyltransferase family 25 protein [Acetobacteraceae bacterium]|nr:glycosyltransferase family 25 protein [Acetobacteraceae bacterium]